MNRRRGMLVAFSLAASVALPVRAHAQRAALEALADVEFWKTDDSSSLLARNNGQFAVQGRLNVWGTFRASRSLMLVAIGYAEAGDAETEHTEVSLDQLTLRFTPSRAFGLDAGKILMPIGSFGQRRFADTNPLIGTPDMYPTQYPYGVTVSGALGAFDYRAAAVSLPAVNTRYTPEPSERMRPVVGVGVSAGPAFRLGLTATYGSYLSHDQQSSLAPGATWSQYHQTIAASDLRLSTGYVETRAEVAFTWYDVPQASQAVRGFGYYVESKATLAPRLFVAGRFEYFRYPFIAVFPTPGGPFWVGTTTREMNGELGLGYRITPAMLLKTSLRKDHWPVHNPSPGVALPDGYAFAVQFSWHIYATDLFTRQY